MAKTSSELQKAMNEARLMQESKPNHPKWLEIAYTKPDKKTGEVKEKYRYAKPDVLGQEIFDQHQKDWLLVQDQDQKEFWTYRPLKHNYKGDARLDHIAKTQYVWQLDDIKGIRGLIHNALKKWHCWRAKTESATFKYITGELESHVKQKNDTVGYIDPSHFLTANGVLNIKDGLIVPNSPRYYFTDFADYSLTNAKPGGAKDIKQWFNETFGDASLTLEQYIGYGLFTTYSMFQAMVIIVNTGGEGKSTIINFINSLFPPSEVSHVSLQQLTQDEKRNKNFSLSELYGKRLNSFNDITGEIIQDTSKIKSTTGEDPMNAPVKNKKDLPFTNHAKLLFACNKLPDFRDSSEGWSRRPYIIRANPIDDFKKKYDIKRLYNERGDFILFCRSACLKQYADQLKHHATVPPRLFETKAMKDDLKEWIFSNDDVAQFLAEKAVPQDQLKNGNHERSFTDTYNAYSKWSKNSGYKPLGKNKFNEAMRDHGIIDRHTNTGNVWQDFELKSDTGNIGNYVFNKPLHTV